MVPKGGDRPVICEEAQALLSAALDGALSPAERRALDDHLAQCPTCAALFEELAGHSRALRALTCEFPDDLHAHILSNLPEQSAPKKKKRAPWVRVGALAACMALVLWAGFSLPGGGNSAVTQSVEGEGRAVADVPMMSSVPEPSPCEEAAEPGTAGGSDSGSVDEADSAAEHYAIKDSSSMFSGAFRPAALSLPVGSTLCNRVTWSESIRNSAQLISSPEELSNLLHRYNLESTEEPFSAFDAAWFETFTLVAVTLTENSGSVTHQVRDLSYEDGVLSVSISRTVPDAGTCDMAAWLLLIETDLTGIDGEITDVILEN